MNIILQKRIEEAAANHKAYAEEFRLKSDTSFICGVDWYRNHQWIPVEEGLPDYEEDVIVTNSYDDYWFAHRSNNEKVIVDEYGFARTPTVLRITHWMHIPELKGGEK